MYQVTAFRELVVFKKKVENTKTKTVGDVDQQTVQCGILNGVPESNHLDPDTSVYTQRAESY